LGAEKRRGFFLGLGLWQSEARLAPREVDTHIEQRIGAPQDSKFHDIDDR